MKNKNSWTKRWLELTDLVSSWSKDTSTKVGCVIINKRNVVLSLGWNGIPRGVIDSKSSRDERPEKYLWYEHAERNAIYNAVFTGRSLEDSVLYCNLFPCADCARAIIQSGIKTVIVSGNKLPDKWLESVEVSKQMFEEAGVEVWLD